VNQVSTKQDVPVVVDNQPLLFDAYKGNGLQPDEEELPEDTDAGASSANKFVPNAEALASLESMGFPRVWCEKALHATGNADVGAASNWLVQHMEDPDIDTPLDLGGDSGGKGSADIDPGKIKSLGDMGFDAPQARQALKETGGDVARAVDWLFSHPNATGDFGVMPGSDKLPVNFQLQSIVCHKGTSVHAGHYVTFIRKKVSGEEDASWVLFNDEKVAKAADIDEMKKFAYIYFFRRL
jgi:ubiquitin carboxyl-terminal hydrolase 5/13